MTCGVAETDIFTLSYREEVSMLRFTENFILLLLFISFPGVVSGQGYFGLDSDSGQKSRNTFDYEVFNGMTNELAELNAELQADVESVVKQLRNDPQSSDTANFYRHLDKTVAHLFKIIAYVQKNADVYSRSSYLSSLFERGNLDSLQTAAKAFEDHGRFSDAEQVYRQIQAIQNQLPAGSRSGDGLKTPDMSGLARTWQRQGRYTESAALFKEVLAEAEKTYDKNSTVIAKIVSDFSALYLLQGRYAESELLCKRALSMFQRMMGTDYSRTMEARKRLADIYVSQGRYQDAEPYIREIYDYYRTNKGRNDPETTTAMMNTAYLEALQGRYEEAETLYVKALDVNRRILQANHPTIADALNNLGLFYLERKRFSDAEPLLAEALTIREKVFGSQHPVTALSLENLARLYDAEGKNAEAETFYNRSIAVFNAAPGAARDGCIRFAARAGFYRKTNRLPQAVADLKRALELSLDVRKHASGSDVQRAETFAGFYHLFALMVEWQNELGNMAQVYDAMERSRAQGLQDLIDSHDIDLFEGMDAATAARLKKNKAESLSMIASLEKQIELLNDNTELSGSEKKKRFSSLYASLNQARKQFVDTTADIQAASPIYRMNIGEDRKPISLATMQKELAGEKTLTLEYLISREKSWLLIYGMETKPALMPLELDEKQAELFAVDAGPLTAKNIETILQNEKKDGVLQSIADRMRISENGLPDAKTAEKLHALWNVLIPDEAVRKQITDGSLDHLLVLPDGALAKLPFEALIVSPDPVSPQYLLDRGPAAIYSPSASMYYNLKRRNVTTKTKAALTVGDPFYDAKTPASDDSTLRELSDSRHAARFRTLKRLPHTASETSWIAESCKENGFSVTRFDRKESTEANVRKNIAGRRLVHLACHGFAEDEYGNMFGGLALTVGNPNNPRDDGFLELAEMFSLNLKGCELAILSACETNLGPNQHGEGTWSMSRGMLASGSRRVVTTNWQVADDASARLVYFFVDAVNKSGDFGNVTQSLHQAKLAIRSGQKNPAWRHPYYWAPFVLVGGK